MGDNRAPILGYIIQYNTSFTPDTWENAFDSVPATSTQFNVSFNGFSLWLFLSSTFYLIDFILEMIYPKTVCLKQLLILKYFADQSQSLGQLHI